MGLSRWKRKEPVSASPATPDTIIGLLGAASNDWAKALRLLLVTCVPLAIIGLMAGAGAAAVLLAVKGTSPLKGSMLIIVIWISCGVVIGTTGAIVSRIRRQTSAASDDKPPAKR